MLCHALILVTFIQAQPGTIVQEGKKITITSENGTFIFDGVPDGWHATVLQNEEKKDAVLLTTTSNSVGIAITYIELKDAAPVRALEYLQSQMPQYDYSRTAKMSGGIVFNVLSTFTLQSGFMTGGLAVKPVSKDKKHAVSIFGLWRELDHPNMDSDFPAIIESVTFVPKKTGITL